MLIDDIMDSSSQDESTYSKVLSLLVSTARDPETSSDPASIVCVTFVVLLKPY